MLRPGAVRPLGLSLPAGVLFNAFRIERLTKLLSGSRSCSRGVPTSPTGLVVKLVRPSPQLLVLPKAQCSKVERPRCNEPQAPPTVQPTPLQCQPGHFFWKRAWVARVTLLAASKSLLYVGRHPDSTSEYFASPNQTSVGRPRIVEPHVLQELSLLLLSYRRTPC